jgi:hypothetical protein
MASGRAQLLSRLSPLWPPILSDLRGLRRALLTLSILFFTIMLLEVDLGHRPALMAQESWLALIPVVWLPLTLIALMAVQIAPSLIVVVAALTIITVAAVVGMVGAGLHMMAAGVDFENLGRVFSSVVWGGRVCPNWPVAITVASVLGFIAAFDAQREPQTLPCDLAGVVTAIAYLLIVAGIVFAVSPALVMASAVCLVAACLLLLAALVALFASACLERSAS